MLTWDELFQNGDNAFAAFVFTVPAHAKRVFPLVIGFHQSGYFYSDALTSITAVLEAGLDQYDSRISASDKIDAEFMRSTLGYSEKQVLADELRAWLANSVRRRDEPPVDVSCVAELWSRLRPTS